MTARERLLDGLHPGSFAIAYRMLGSVSEAEDVVQEALLRVHRAIDGKSEDNARQLATRARRYVARRRPRFQTTREQRDELALRFFAAAEQGDLAGLEAMLTHDVELTADGGGKVPAIARPLRGRSRVARTLINGLRLLIRVPGASLRPVEVNGGPGALFLDAQQRLIGVLALDIAGGRITSISAIINPHKLAHLGPVADARSLPR